MNIYMNENHIRKSRKILSNFIYTLMFVFIIFSLFDFSIFATEQKDEIKEYKTSSAKTKIHVISVKTSGNSVLIESNGKFGVIDSGEDNDYPDQYRDGVTLGNGREEEVIAYMKKIGVTKDNLEFYIGTHPHSDHIGSADEVIREFHPKHLYTPEYKDEYIKNPMRLWDNLYVYNNMLDAANEVGTQIHLSFDEGYNFEFGDTVINLYNVDQGYRHIPVEDANDFSLGVKITDKTTKKSAFVGGDMNNFNGAEDRESDKIGKVDIMVLCHHCYYGSNSHKFITTLDPSIMIVPNRYTSANKDHDPNDIMHNTYSTLLNQTKKGSRLYAEGHYKGIIDALVVSFDENLTTNIPEMNLETPFIGVSNVTSGLTYNYYIDGRYQSNIHDVPISQWMHDEKGWWLKLTENQYVKNSIVRVDNKIYGFDESGYMVTGWFEHRGNWYYFNENGSMHKGWKEVDKHIYYFNEDGMMVNSPTTVDGKVHTFNEKGYYIPVNNGSDVYNVIIDGMKYTMDKEGTIFKDWHLIDGSWYYVENGNFAKGWKNISGVWYYFTSDNKMVTGLQKIDGTPYFFSKLGAMATSWSEDSEGTWYYANPSGVLQKGWLKSGSSWYYLDSEYKMVTGKHNIDGVTYFFASSGAMTTGWFKGEDDMWYYVESSGALSKGWSNISGIWYYFDSEHKMVTGAQKIDGKPYYFASSGAMITGWFKDNDGDWSYAASSGEIISGWVNSGGSWYYMDSSYKMVTGRQDIDGISYFFASSGAMATNWAQDKDGTWYYASGSGALVKGWIKSGAWYYFDSEHKMVTGRQEINGDIYYFSYSGAMETH